MTTVPVLAEPGALTGSVTPGRPPGRRFRSDLVTALFMGPAAVLLGAIVVYPAVATVVRSFYGRNANQYVANLTSANEVPANSSSATGTANFTVNGTTVNYTVTYSNLSGPPTALRYSV